MIKILPHIILKGKWVFYSEEDYFIKHEYSLKYFLLNFSILMNNFYADN